MTRLLTLTTLAALLLLGAAVPRDAQAETIQDLFDAANDSYWRGEFEAARDLYHRIVEDFRVDNPEVYLNLGNAYARLDLLGSAILYYKRALRCAPGDETEKAIDTNLARARGLLQARHRERIEQNRMLYEESHGAWYDLFHLLTEDTLAVVLLLLCAALAAALIVARLSPRVSLRRVLRPTAAVLAVVALAFGGLLAGHRATSSAVRLGIVIHADVKLKATRLPDAATVTLPEGLELRILNDPEEGEMRVQLSNGREGYVPEASVKEI